MNKGKELLNLWEEIGTSVAAMMGTMPINVAGKEQPSKEGKKREKKAVLGYKYKKIRGFKNKEGA